MAVVGAVRLVVGGGREGVGEGIGWRWLRRMGSVVVGVHGEGVLTLEMRCVVGGWEAWRRYSFTELKEPRIGKHEQRI